MQARRKGSDYLKLAAKGMLMGAADAVPGVSGGTIAFITGIYQELIHSIKLCGVHALQMLFRQGPMAAFSYVNGAFLVTLLAGMLLSILSLSRVVVYLLNTHPLLLWSFFFGLILAAVWSLVRHIEKYTATLFLAFLAGTAIAYVITSLSPSAIDPTAFNFFLAGMIAICAMILPGISGSFILLLLGMYGHVMLAIKQFQFDMLSLFAGGCVVGILSFSRVLDWMFTKHKNITLAILGGFVLGSLNKVWPWKEALETVVKADGEIIVLVERNILPSTFEQISGQSASLTSALVLMVVGFACVILLEIFGNTKSQKSN
jgi:putative membrane protein